MPSPDVAPAIASLLTRYVRAQLDGDRAGAIRLMLDDGLAAGVDPATLRTDVIGAAQREIGRLWESNAITVADEHQATAISQVVLAHLYPHLRRGPDRGRMVMVACVAGEMHDMPARIASDALEAAGYSVRFLGADVPTDALVRAVVSHHPDVLALSVTMPFHLAAAWDAVNRVRAAAPRLPPIVLGGRGFAHVTDVDPMRVTLSCGDLAALVEVVARVGGWGPA
jgi:MerR family transcriptional regulator, light-induced transcriptional regulator